MFSLNNNRFYKIFRSTLKTKNFELGRKISDDLYEVFSENISFNIDVHDAKRDYELNKDITGLENLLLQLELDFTAKYKLVSFHNAQNCLRHLLVREELLSEDCISSDFMNDVKKIIAFTTDNQNIFPLSAVYIKKWGIPKDVLFAVADRNMCDILRKTELYVSTIAGKIKVIEFPVENAKLRSALLICSNFKKLVSEKLGARFLVIAPSQETMLAVEDVTNNIIESFGPVVLEEYKKSVNKLSTEVFLFSPSGISVAGKFQLPVPAEVNA